jgi:anti-anti-sigma factor
MMTNTETAILSCRSYSLERVEVLELAGVCDIATREVLRHTVAGALEPAPKALIVDLSGVEFCDAGSAAVFLTAGRRTRLVLIGAHGIVNRVFEVLDPSSTLPRSESVAQAVTRLASAGNGARQPA